jgi:hypothetical protein
MKSKRRERAERGKLRIGDDWNAIRIIALSQSNPLKAAASFTTSALQLLSRPSSRWRPI